MVRTQTQGRLAATSQRLPVWCKLPTSINTGRSATPATSLTRPPLDRHKKGLRGRGKEGRPTTQHLALGSLMVSTGPFHLPIPGSHPDKAPTRLLSNLSFSPRPPQRRNCYRQRDLGKSPQLSKPSRCRRWLERSKGFPPHILSLTSPLFPGSWKVPTAQDTALHATQALGNYACSHLKQHRAQSVAQREIPKRQLEKLSRASQGPANPSGRVTNTRQNAAASEGRLSDSRDP